MVSSLAFHDIAPFLRFMTSMRVGGGGEVVDQCVHRGNFLNPSRRWVCVYACMRVCTRPRRGYDVNI